MFYHSIATHYDNIFKNSLEQSSFIQHFTSLINHKHNSLEVGSATGNLTILLSKLFTNTVGIDLDKEMLRIAKEKASGLSSITFKELNMLEIKNNYSQDSFNLIVSFGNTLVHLSDPDQIKNFLFQAYTTLAPGGMILLQILNYDYILKQKIDQLPLIENNLIKFERYYNYPSDKKTIEFKTILTIKDSMQELTNTIELFPLKKEELLTTLNEIGFKEIELFGSFNLEPLRDNSLPLILKASKS